MAAAVGNRQNVAKELPDVDDGSRRAAEAKEAKGDRPAEHDSWRAETRYKL